MESLLKRGRWTRKHVRVRENVRRQIETRDYQYYPIDKRNRVAIIIHTALCTLRGIA